ncbi:29435_t:CDS:2, partial [Gigaspora margarita]
LQKNKHLKALACDIHDGIEFTIQFHKFYDTVLNSIKLNLVAIMPEIVREYKVEKRQQEITRIIDHIIPIHIVQVNSIASNGSYRSFKDILSVLISIYQISKQQHCVPDELHVKLRITDVLFECFFFELSIKLTFNKKQKNNKITIQKQIESTIYSININIFKFKEPEIPKGKWHWMLLIGPNKLIILNKFSITSFILDQ